LRLRTERNRQVWPIQDVTFWRVLASYSFSLSTEPCQGSGVVPNLTRPAPSSRTGLQRWVKLLTNSVPPIAIGWRPTARKFCALWHGFQPVGSGRGLIADLSRDERSGCVTLLRAKRSGGLFNENFAAHLTALPPNTTAPGLS
jgi:hypothetical protein